MDSRSEANQRDDVMAHATQQRGVSLERVRRARERFTEASHLLAQTRHEMEKDPGIERLRRARELLEAEHHRWAHVQRHTAPRPTTDD